MENEQSDSNRLTAMEASYELKKRNAAQWELIDYLKNGDPPLRAAAALQLGDKPDSASLKPLLQALSDREAIVREFAASGLASLRDVSAVDPLIQILLHDNSGRVRASAAEALRIIGDNRAVEPLIKTLLYDTNTSARVRAAQALGEIRDSRAAKPLSQCLRDDLNDVVRKATEEALRKVKGVKGE